ncbi:MAG: c-type cytochrome [Betaproteobacteria bacterium]|nr:c-type cytochrome [Betaproteobacteria bacterium]
MASNNDVELGKKTFESICTGCHSSGALGAPKYANKQDWAPRIAQGIDVLYKSAINGKNSMPAKGGNPALSDAEIKAAVNYMVAAVK